MKSRPTVLVADSLGLSGGRCCVISLASGRLKLGVGRVQMRKAWERERIAFGSRTRRGCGGYSPAGRPYTHRRWWRCRRRASALPVMESGPTFGFSGWLNLSESERAQPAATAEPRSLGRTYAALASIALTLGEGNLVICRFVHYE
jgi:hypothetical protein